MSWIALSNAPIFLNYWIFDEPRDTGVANSFLSDTTDPKVLKVAVKLNWTTSGPRVKQSSPQALIAETDCKDQPSPPARTAPARLVCFPKHCVAQTNMQDYPALPRLTSSTSYWAINRANCSTQPGSKHPRTAFTVSLLPLFPATQAVQNKALKLLFFRDTRYTQTTYEWSVESSHFVLRIDLLHR